ncbi:MAG: hypothetical protein ABR981_00095 [Candidatus Micrarchaeaceae archaeon]|jgi:hypothetical protein
MVARYFLIFSLIAIFVLFILAAGNAHAANSSSTINASGTINYTVNSSKFGTSTKSINNLIVAIQNFINSILHALANAFNLK